MYNIIHKEVIAIEIHGVQFDDFLILSSLSQ